LLGNLEAMTQPGPDPDDYPPIDPREPVPDDPGELSPDTPDTLPPAPVEPGRGPGEPGGVPEPAARLLDPTRARQVAETIVARD
jgi:hypothetical protein